MTIIAFVPWASPRPLPTQWERNWEHQADLHSMEAKHSPVPVARPWAVLVGGTRLGVMEEPDGEPPPVRAHHMPTGGVEGGGIAGRLARVRDWIP